ncbi:MAG: metal-dependent hydrolase [Planctomycetaceae bacterium]
MTTPEHTLVGIHGAFLLGLPAKMGWAVVVLIALVSNVPDLDGLPLLISVQQFESGHRVWGHNFLVIGITSLLLAWTQARYHWIERAARKVKKILPAETEATLNQPEREISLLPLMGVLFLFQSLHLVCDLVVSGGHGLSDWHVLPFWPFSDTGYVFPLIPWGDVGPTVILMIGTITLAKMPNRTRTVAGLTLVMLCGYLVGRGLMRGTI